MFQVNDTIQYQAVGVCKIADISLQNLYGASHRYYVLEPVHQTGSVIYVPVDNEELVARMHRILSKEEIDELIEQIPEQGSVWIDNEKKRHEEFQKILADGKHGELIALIRTLHYRQEELLTKKRKNLNVADERAMREAENLLYDEFSAVLGIQPNEVHAYITRKLDEN